MDNPLRLNNLVIECDIGDMRVSFVDANEVREYDGPMQHFHSAYELQYVTIYGRLIRFYRLLKPGS